MIISSHLIVHFIIQSFFSVFFVHSPLSFVNLHVCICHSLLICLTSLDLFPYSSMSLIYSQPFSMFHFTSLYVQCIMSNSSKSSNFCFFIRFVQISLFVWSNTHVPFLVPMLNVQLHKPISLIANQMKLISLIYHIQFWMWHF